MSFLRALPLSLLLLAALPPEARAQPPAFTGIRALGMGGALRAAATGESGPLLNPAGMSLARSYILSGSYQQDRPGPAHVGHLAIVDSTSGFNVAGGVYYSYLNARAGGPPDESGHEGGLSLSLPLGERIVLGGTVKYTKLVLEPAAGPDEKTSGVTFDAGLIIRPLGSVSLAVVGYNLRDLGTAERPVSLGGGVAISPIEGVLVTADGLVDFTTTDDERDNEISLMGGAEYVFAQRAAFRAGGGKDGYTEHGYFAVGASLLGEAGAVDLGFRRDVTGEDKATVFGVTGRLFVPAP
jgi:hypothetical protein